MLGRIVEIANDNRHLSVCRGFLVVREKGDGGNELGRIPLDDILAVIANAHGLSYSNNLLVALLDRDIPLVISSDRYEAKGMLWPVEGHALQAKRFDAQIAASLPKKKNLWASVVRQKIFQQAELLTFLGKQDFLLRGLIKQVRSGDSENREGVAARIYWKELFGEGFLRDRSAGGINTLLNYGYTVLRSAMARAVMAAGLHPSIGLHHRNASDAMRLVDDLMEPFRPIVDAIVFRVWCQDTSGTQSLELTPEIKRALVSALFFNTLFENEQRPAMVSMQKMAQSLAKVFLGEEKTLSLPQFFDYESLWNSDGDFGLQADVDARDV